MNYLLDTHALLWFLEGKTDLSLTAKTIIEDASNKIFVSTASFFEIAIKLKTGKFINSFASLDLIIQKTRENQIDTLPLSSYHTVFYDKIPLNENHRDPFDRILLAVAISEGMSLISIDEKFSLYSDLVNIVW